MRFHRVAIALLVLLVGCTNLEPRYGMGAWHGASLTPVQANAFCWRLEARLKADGYKVSCTDSVGEKSIRFRRTGDTGSMTLKLDYNGRYELFYEVSARSPVSSGPTLPDDAPTLPAEKLILDTLSTAPKW